MSNNIILRKSKNRICGEVHLSGSKSISNRVLIIQSLCEDDFVIQNISTSDDTTVLKELLASKELLLDTHHAGTAYRFLTAYLSTQKGQKTLTGSERMKQRPIGPLVEALRQLGAEIQYKNNEGFPPLDIVGNEQLEGGVVSISADISSQYITALLLIAPTLPKGLKLELKGDLVSKSYVLMTLRIMEHFGIKHSWVEDNIVIEPQRYIAKDFYVEADWSSASYYYSIAAMSLQAEITIFGLQKDSLQGDSVIAKIGETFGVQSQFLEGRVRLTKQEGATTPSYFEYNFLQCPDLAQTISVLCAGLGVQALFTGLQTLRIKETDRISALQNELQSFHVFLTKLPDKFSQKSGVTYFMQEGKAITGAMPLISTYQDHRMAMAFAPLSMLMDVEIENKDVISKSYPDFWRDLAQLLK